MVCLPQNCQIVGEFLLPLSNWKGLFTRGGVELRPRSIELVEGCVWIRKGLRETKTLTGDD